MTGARGFLGRAAVDRLVDLGWAVDAVTSSRDRSERIERDDITWHGVDLLDRARTETLVDRLSPTHLLHLAWAPNRGIYRSPENARWAEAGAQLLSAFVECGGRRAVAAGSSAEYDWSAGICEEGSTPLAGGGAYGEAKRALAESFAGHFPTDSRERSGVWARIFFLYGPHEPEGRLVPAVIRSLIEGGPVRCSEGSQVRDYLYVDDAAEALVRLLDSDLRGPVNVASGRGVAVREIVLGLADRIGGAERIEWGEPDDYPRVVADVARLEGELGWSPSTGLDAGLDRSIAWWRDRIAARG